jgi:hypothetical protein
MGTKCEKRVEEYIMRRSEIGKLEIISRRGNASKSDLLLPKNERVCSHDVSRSFQVDLHLLLSSVSSDINTTNLLSKAPRNKLSLISSHSFNIERLSRGGFTLTLSLSCT